MKTYIIIKYVLLALLLVGLVACDSGYSGRKAPVAKQGVLDLRDWDFKKDGPLKLDGEWEIFWEKLIDGYDSKKGTPGLDGFYSMLGGMGWEGHQLTDGRVLGHLGYGSFRLKVLMPKSVNEVIEHSRHPVSFAMGRFTAGSAHLLSVFNSAGVSLGSPIEMGTVGIDAVSNIPVWAQNITSLRVEPELIFIWQVSNYHHFFGGPLASPMLGSFDQIQNGFLNKFSKDYFVIGLLVIMGLYHFILFALHAKDHSTLWFGILCLQFAGFNLIEAGYLNRLYTDALLWQIQFKIHFGFCIYLVVPVFILFLKNLFREQVIRSINRSAIAAGCLFALGCWAAPASWIGQKYMFHVFLAALLFVIIYINFVLVRALKGSVGLQAQSLLTGFWCFAFSIIHDLLMVSSIIPYITPWVPMGLSVFILFQALTIAINNQRNYQNKIIAERKVKETQFLVLENMKRADKLKDEFLANTSHELRTPINGIVGIVESLIDGATGKLADNTKANLKMVVASGQRLSSLVNDILDFSKLKNQDIALQIKPVDLRALIEVVMVLSKSLIKSKDLKIKNWIAEDIPPVEADENRIQQVMFNLIGNAVKFTEMGEITISAVRKDRCVYLAVQDTGIGIPQDRLASIFESFEQADGSTAREYGGTGLGLTISRKLIQLHGGDIEVSSKVGEGSIFTFSLPVTLGEAAETPIATVHNLLETVQEPEDELQDDQIMITIENDNTVVGLGNNNAGYKIMIVDDEPINIQVLQNQLMLYNYKTVTATNGMQALKQLATTQPDLILLDLMMPKMSGYEVCCKIRETYGAVILPVIMLTAKNQVTDLVQGLDCGANDYLTKPFHKEELLARVQTHIQFASAVRNLKQQEHFKLELETAKHVQALFIPDRDPQLPGIDIASFYHAASQTGGDWYDYRYRQDQQTLDILIGDVTGHGVPAALITAVVNSFYRTLEQHRQAMQQLGNTEDHLLEPTYLLHQLNSVLHYITTNSYNMTFFYSSLDLRTKVLTYTSAAHVPCYVYRPEKFNAIQHGKAIKRSILSLTTPGAILGKLPDQHYQLDHYQLQTDDVLIWFTDGLTENKNEQGKMFGNRELKGVVKSSAHLNAQQIKDNIIDAAYHHYGDTPCDDDVTLIVGKIEA